MKVRAMARLAPATRAAAVLRRAPAPCRHGEAKTATRGSRSSQDLLGWDIKKGAARTPFENCKPEHQPLGAPCGGPTDG